MDAVNRSDIRLSPEGLKGRCFLLGNKRAFSVCLPAAAGTSDSSLHPHKWFGAYLYGRKFFEGQVVRASGTHQHFLSARYQRSFNQSLTGARREYVVEDVSCSEEYFVPDGVQGFACTFSGDIQLHIEPEFDMRFYRVLNHGTDSYQVEEIESGVLVSNALPGGTYDDESETFLADSADDNETRIFAAARVVGDDVWSAAVPAPLRSRRKLFRQDLRRHRFLALAAPEEAMYDHAPLWNQSASRVYAPVRFGIRGHGTIVYGFGATREEALSQLDALAGNLLAYQVQKSESAQEINDRAQLETGAARIDLAYTQVLNRLMDCLVARHAVAQDTALDRPATMILAGNRYFHDSWKRDENIALGFLLALGFYDLARDVIRDTWQLQDERSGRLPQRIRAGEDPPYNSSDGTLWALQRLHQYWRCTGDEALLHDKLPMVQLFFQRSVERTVNGMLPSGRTTAPDYLWETWMDTPHTPRDGFPVEIQMLWIACLRHYRPLIAGFDAPLESRMAEAEAEAWNALKRFQIHGMPADSLDENGEVRDFITPNPYFCFGVGLDLGPSVERAMRDMGRRQLAGQQGIRTLAPQDWGRVFSPEFLGNSRHVRGRRMLSLGKFNYHRGVEWNWLAQFFVQAELKYGDPDTAYRKYLRPQVEAALECAGVGGISELFDLSGNRGPEFQAWSMSGFLEAVHAFAGVRIDLPNQSISLEPQVPAVWPQLTVRKWYGTVPFDLTYSHDDCTRSLNLAFPWGEAPDCRLDIALVLPTRQTADCLTVELDGLSYAVNWKAEPMGNTGKARVRFSVPACTQIEVKLALKKAGARVALTA